MRKKSEPCNQAELTQREPYYDQTTAIEAAGVNRYTRQPVLACQMWTRFSKGFASDLGELANNIKPTANMNHIGDPNPFVA